MHAGRIDRMDRVNAGHHGRDDRAGHFVDDGAEAGVLLRRPADHGERPDRARPMIDALRRSAPGNRGPGCNNRDDRRTAPPASSRSGSTVPTMQKSASAGIGRKDDRDRRSPAAGVTRRMRRPPSAPAKASSGSPSGNGITAASVSAGRPADDDIDAERHAASKRRRRDARRCRDGSGSAVRPRDRRSILVAGKLHAVHAEVGVAPAGPLDVLGVNLRQGDERPAVAAASIATAAAARIVVSMREDRPVADADAARHEATGAGHVAVAPRLFPERGRIDLQFDQMANGGERVAEEEAGALGVPNRLLTIGKPQPLTRVKNRAGPPRRRRAAGSRPFRGTDRSPCSMRTSCPVRSRSATQSRRLR